ncbi:MAG: site-specific DNA-methyltransferase [Planctomycetes bacterium]|nr:site-specific DNA-methyltransferase [Planctomycetota bacterium]
MDPDATSSATDSSDGKARAARTILTGDGVAWLAAQALPPTHAVVTSLPDVSEMPSMDVDVWREWFVATVALACTQVADAAPAIFYQTDIKSDGRWIDKGHLVALGASRAGSACLFHKIVCRAPAGTTTFGRPSFAHLLGFSRSLRLPVKESSADVLPGLGEMTWSRAMGTAACEEACRFLVRSTACRVVADPFCGLGTALAVANGYGLDAVGVERSPKRAERARKLVFVRERGIVGPPVRVGTP